MKSTQCIAILLFLSCGIAKTMEEQSIIMEAITPPPDLMPPQAYALIERLKNPDKDEQPDHITIIGHTGSGKSTICKRIVEAIDVSPLYCDGYAFMRAYGQCFNELAIQQSIKEYLIMPTLKRAQDHQKSKAVFIIPHFEHLYNNQYCRPARYILKALNPANYADLAFPLLIINESLPLKNLPNMPPVEGENIIYIQPPNLAARKDLIRYWVEKRGYPHDENAQNALAQRTEGRTIATIAALLSHEAHILNNNNNPQKKLTEEHDNDDDRHAHKTSPTNESTANPVPISLNNDSLQKPVNVVPQPPAPPSGPLSKAEFKKLKQGAQSAASVQFVEVEQSSKWCCCTIV